MQGPTPPCVSLSRQEFSLRAPSTARTLAMSSFLRWTVRLFAGLLLLFLLAAVSLYAASAYRLHQTYDVSVQNVPIPTDSAAIARGRHIAVTRGCGDCHGPRLGGSTAVSDPMIGSLHAPNLTPGGVGGTYSDADWIRAIRHGIAPNGSPLVFMPSFEYYYLSDEDLGALIAYLKQLPPIEKNMVAPKLGPMGRAMVVAGRGNFRLSAARIDHDAPRPTAPPRGPTAAYGEYLAYSCVGCHGSELTGGPISGAPPSWPPAANITPHADGIGAWTKADFFRAMRKQQRPDGSRIDPVMPADMGKLTDQELTALWKYLQTVTPRRSE